MISSSGSFNPVPKKTKQIYEFRDSVDFYCQHGPKECHGNMVHACALAEYRNLGQVLPFIECMEYELYGKPKPNISLIASKVSDNSCYMFKISSKSVSHNHLHYYYYS